MIGETASLRSAHPAGNRFSVLDRVLPPLKRYGLSTGGPLATSGAHFIASLILLRNLPPADFGLFSFLLIVVPFCLSLSGALIAASFITGLRRARTLIAEGLAGDPSEGQSGCRRCGIACRCRGHRSPAARASATGLILGLLWRGHGAAPVRPHLCLCERTARAGAFERSYLCAAPGRRPRGAVAAACADDGRASRWRWSRPRSSAFVAFGRRYALRQLIARRRRRTRRLCAGSGAIWRAGR